MSVSTSHINYVIRRLLKRTRFSFDHNSSSLGSTSCAPENTVISMQILLTIFVQPIVQPDLSDLMLSMSENKNKKQTTIKLVNTTNISF